MPYLSEKTPETPPTHDARRHCLISIVVAFSMTLSALLLVKGNGLADGETLADVPTFTAVVTDTLIGVSDSAAAWGDYDNDGDLDILLTGSGASQHVSVIYRNDGFDTFTPAVTDTLTDVASSSVAWGDYDSDGDLDILLAGSGAGQHVSVIYRNDGSDTFTAAVTETLIGVSSGSTAWGDYDNDGDLDILLAGYDSSFQHFTKLYRNDGSDVFTEAITDTFAQVSGASVAWGDYDNDGDLDILLTGYETSNNVAIVYRNDGSDTFTAAITDTLTPVSSGTSVWGDYDNDGDLDILHTGGYGGFYYEATIYRNDGSDTFTAAVTDTLTPVAGASAAWGDCDNDGDLDILLTGFDGSSRVAAVYRNDGSDTFTAVVTDTLTPVTNGSAAWGDYDNDGDLDILLTGEKASSPQVFAAVYRNNLTTRSVRPAPPGNLSADVTGNAVTLSWSAPPPTCTTPITGLTYNLYVGTSPGKGDIVPPMAFTTADPLTNGLRLLPAMGGAQHGTTATLELPCGIYYWSVQAVDHTLAGSAFATEHSFTVWRDIVCLPLILKD